MDWKSFDKNKEFEFADDKPYLIELIDKFEETIDSKKNIPFKIVDIRDKGFVVKTEGLFGFISFHHMPWSYQNINSWTVVYPAIKGKIFFARVYHFSKNPLTIILDGEVSQFNIPALNIGEKYAGLIIYKTNYGLFVDIGFHFAWKYGSIVGMIHRSSFETDELFENFNIGDAFDTHFLGFNESGQNTFGNLNLLEDWLTGEIDKLVGKKVPVDVIKLDDEKINLLVYKKHKCILPLNQKIYPRNHVAVSLALKQLNDGDIIHCQVIEANHQIKKLILKWDFLREIDEIVLRQSDQNPINDKNNDLENTKNSLENLVKKQVVDKLNLIGKTVEVEVVKKVDNLGEMSNKYLIENRFSGKLTVTNDHYRISNKEKIQIEKNLQEGEILNCEVTGISNNQLSIKWKLMDAELSRFIEA